MWLKGIPMWKMGYMFLNKPAQHNILVFCNCVIPVWGWDTTKLGKFHV